MKENLRTVKWLAKPLAISFIAAQMLIGNAHVFASDGQKITQQYDQKDQNEQVGQDEDGDEKVPKTVGNLKLQILGINDFHGQLDTTSDYGNGPVGRADYLAAYLKQRKAQNPNTLLVHAGDSVGATAPVSSLERDKPTMEFMNMMHFDVGTLGNHEFDQGLAALKAQIYGGPDPVKTDIVFKKAKFPYINANAVDSVTKEPLFKPYVIKNIAGVKVGFIGVVTMATVQKVSPDALKGVTLVDQAPVVNNVVQELKQQPCQG
jgi:2',3'-cyclic-nucleotide 2'-phosphodiesterase/3'-nucleotidase/5'-nucleotidase